MEIINLSQAGKYAPAWEKLDRLVAWLKSQDLAALPVGKIQLEEDILVNVQEYETTPESKFETHDHHFDLQMVVKGEERFLVAPREMLFPATDYNPVKDVTFYTWTSSPTVDVTLQEGDYIIVSPDEAHAPHLMGEAGPGPVKKIVGKVKF